MGVTIKYTNNLGGSIEFSNASHIYIENIDGLSSNDISLSESDVINGVGTINTGCSISSKQMTFTGFFSKDKEIHARLLAVILPGVGGKLEYVDTDNDIDVFWEGTPTSTPILGWREQYTENFQFKFKAFYPYAKSNKLYSYSFLETNTTELLPIDLTNPDGFMIGDQSVKKEISIYNNGLEAGMIIRVKSLAPVNSIEFTDTTAGYNVNLIVGLSEEPTDVGDVVEISTEPNNVYCHLIKADGNVKNIITNMQLSNEMPMIHRGTSFYTARINHDITYKKIIADVRVEYRKVFAGV